MRQVPRPKAGNWAPVRVGTVRTEGGGSAGERRARGLAEVGRVRLLAKGAHAHRLRLLEACNAPEERR